MKICFITTNIFSLGGVQRVVSVLANGLSKEHEVEILCTSDRYPVDRKMYNLSADIKVDLNGQLLVRDLSTKLYSKIGKTINKKTSIFKDKRLMGFLLEAYYPKVVRERFIKYLNERNYDIVIGVEGSISLLLGSISKQLNSKTIGWQHNSYEAYLREPDRYLWKQEELLEYLVPKLDRYVVLTDHDKRMYKINNNIDCEVIYNPKSFSSKDKSTVEKKCFLAAGRFVYQKGFDLLIEAFQLFSSENSAWKLIIVGEGEEEEQLISLIDKYKLKERIELKPFTDNIKQYFLQTSILLLSSRWEGMPMIVLEALEMGVPVIAYDITAAQQLIHSGKEGVLVPKFDVKQFANAMAALSKSYELRKEMSLNAINHAKNFEIDNIVNKWESLFADIMKN